VLTVNTSVFTRRRIERFARLVESGGTRCHHTRSRTGDDLEDLAGIGQRLGSIEFTVRADLEFRTGLRAMLMATIERDGIGATALDPEETVVLTTTARHRRTVPARIEPQRRPAHGQWLTPLRSRRARVAVVVGLAAGTLAISGMSAASGDAIPGDALYGIKRSAERAQLALAGSEVSRGQLYLEFARTRMNESGAMRDDPIGFAALLTDMDEETRQGVRLLTGAAVQRHDPAALNVVDRFVDEQRRALDRLADTAPATTRARALSSQNLLTDIARRSADLRPTLNCGGLAEAKVDALGPKPARCAARQPTSPRGPGGSTGTRHAADR
jgi:hypothetical protein